MLKTSGQRAVLAAALLAAAPLAGCGTSVSPGTVSPNETAAPARATAVSAPPARPSPTASGSPRPLACTSVTSQGSFAPAAADSAVTLAQIGQAVGFTVSLSMPDPQSALAFNGYEGCRYQFATPAGGAQEDVTLVVGTNPLDAKTAAAEFAATRSRKQPLSERQSDCMGCGYAFTPLPGLGQSALSGLQNGTDEVVVALQGPVYVEVGPGDLRESRMVALARLILSHIRS